MAIFFNANDKRCVTSKLGVSAIAPVKVRKKWYLEEMCGRTVALGDLIVVST